MASVFVSNKNPSVRYRVLGMLGRGAFGRCYKVLQQNDQAHSVWACKSIDKSGFNSRKLLDRVKYEIKVMRRLPQHENVVQLHRIFQDDERVFITMELCTPRTVHDLLQKRKRLTEFESRYFIGQVASGLAALHRVCIIHRDIKHSNLLLDSRNRVKIADFGLSTILDVETDRKKSFLGTPNFLAPELVSRDERGHSFGVDVWATGVLLYIMLYGRPPFSSPNSTVKTGLEVLYGRIVTNDVVFPTQPPTSYAAKKMIEKLCCKREDQRIEASEIFYEDWFLASGDSAMPGFMPDSIFHTPIRSISDHRDLVAGIEGAVKPASRIAATLNPRVPVSKHTEGVARRSRVRQPLEPIIEHENQVRRTTGEPPKPILRSARPVVSSVDTSASTTRVSTETLHLSERVARIRMLSNQQANAKDAGGATVAPPPATTSRYALRSKGTEEIPAREVPRSVRWSDSPRAGAHSPRAPAARLPQAEDTALEPTVQAEFGQVTKLSEEYLPSLQHWHDRLQKFQSTARRYQQLSGREYEAWLARTSWADEPEARYPRVGMYVLNWMMLVRYGLGFRMSDGTIGTLFNDNTSLLHMSNADGYAYVRPFQDRSCVGYYAADAFPAELDKKRRVVKGFGHKIVRDFLYNVDAEIYPVPEHDDVVRCMLQALATTAGMMFLLTGGVIQFSLRNHAKLFLYEDSHIFYKDSDGRKWHFNLADGPARLVRDAEIDVDKFLLCLEYAQKVLASDKFSGHRAR
ncbi:Cell cycle serine/threonine-protein kinase cdc5/MSD2 [Linderina pennispora]|nr:Cell cycle serine/threonine-protein kinase cdc5/MSD2 [Linderina pennispora]